MRAFLQEYKKCNTFITNQFIFLEAHSLHFWNTRLHHSSMDGWAVQHGTTRGLNAAAGKAQVLIVHLPNLTHCLLPEDLKYQIMQLNKIYSTNMLSFYIWLDFFVWKILNLNNSSKSHKYNEWMRFLWVKIDSMFEILPSASFLFDDIVCMICIRLCDSFLGLCIDHTLWIKIAVTTRRFYASGALLSTTK